MRYLKKLLKLATTMRSNRNVTAIDAENHLTLKKLKIDDPACALLSDLYIFIFFDLCT
ncbi:unnamed protein product [Strongylus vulgaris]|uniref:Uncharacterized protein n=1 Tax=Strongylus vulgaris TaxID=40348 RepID=A0A3P7M2U9_STRVU|nr:unnamed protein product [Strongylus vulgaris]